MNEFILFDILNRRFYNQDEISIDYANGLVHLMHTDFKWNPTLILLADCDILYNVGKTDDTPEQNKIYADCSIVEFGYTSGKSIGYFTYNKDRLSYDLIDRGANLSYAYNFRQIHSLKVIGTLQEDKHLLGGGLDEY